MFAIRRTDGVNSHATIDHRTNNIVDCLACLFDTNVLLSAIEDSYFEPVMVQVNGSENTFKSDFFTFILSCVRWGVFLYRIVDDFP